MIVRLIWWQLLKAFQRAKYRSVKLHRVQSLRLSELDSCSVVAISQEKLPLQHYKQLTTSDFRRTLRLNDVVINPKSGVFWHCNNFIQESSIYRWTELQRWEPYPYFAKKIEDNFINLPDNGYYHFLTEDLPRFLTSIEGINEFTVLTGSNNKYVKDSLKISGVERYVNSNFPVRISSLIFSEKIPNYPFSSHDYEELMNLKNKIKTNIVKSHKVFISRRTKLNHNAVTRGLEYVSFIEKLAYENGCHIVYAENLSLEDQIALFSQTDELYGFHGAGLANLIWMNPGSKVVEITKQRITRHFEHLSQIARHSYSRILIEDEDSISNIFK